MREILAFPLKGVVKLHVPALDNFPDSPISTRISCQSMRSFRISKLPDTCQFPNSGSSALPCHCPRSSLITGPSGPCTTLNARVPLIPRIVAICRPCWRTNTVPEETRTLGRGGKRREADSRERVPVSPDFCFPGNCHAPCAFFSREKTGFSRYNSSGRI